MQTTVKQKKWLTESGITKWHDSASIIEAGVRALQPSSFYCA